MPREADGSSATMIRSGEWPLVGRQVELDRLARARAEGSVGVVVHAPAGVGKSRLAAEAVAAAEAGGAHVVWAQGTRSAASVPLGAFAHLVPPQSRSDDLLSLMRGSIEALRDAAGDRPLVLAVDDAHQLDAPSAALVQHVAEVGAGFVVATVRSGERCRDAIVSLWKDLAAERLELVPFSEQETAAVVEGRLDGPVDQSTLLWLHERSGGNALYLRELVLGALDEGALRCERGLWRLLHHPPISRSLGELVAARMVALGEDERAALELLAFGEPLRADELGGLAGDAPLLELERHGLITVEQGRAATAPGVRLAHPLYGEAIRAGVGALRAHAIRRELAAAVQTRTTVTPDDKMRVARWLLDAGEPVPSGLLLDAAGAANAAGDPELGAHLASLAVEAGAGVTAKLLLARAHIARRRFEEAEEVLASAEHELPDEATALAYLEQRADLLYWLLRRRDQLAPLLERASGWWPGPAWQQRLRPLRSYAGAATTEVFGTHTPEFEELLADPDLDPELRRQTEPLYVVAQFYAGRCRPAWELACRVRAAVPLEGPTEEISLIMWSTVAIESGLEWNRLEDEMADLFAAAVHADDSVAAGFTAIGIGALRLYAGHLPDAVRWLAEAELQLERRDSLGVLAIVRSYQVGAAYAAGDVDGAAASLARMHEGLAGAAPLPNQAPYVARAEGWAAAADGDRPRAQELLLAAAEEQATTPLYAAMLAYEALRLGAPARRVAVPLALLADRTDAPLAAAWSAHAHAGAARDGAALLEAADAFERIGALRCACEAAADAAAVYVDEGREDSARRAAARSKTLYERGEGGAAPTIDGLHASAVALTAREAQIVELVARGLSNAEIAERLVLSVRTVESHVYNAMNKRGVSDRRDLA